MEKIISEKFDSIAFPDIIEAVVMGKPSIKFLLSAFSRKGTGISMI